MAEVASSLAGGPLHGMAGGSSSSSGTRLGDLLEHLRIEGEALSGLVESTRRENSEYAGQGAAQIDSVQKECTLKL
jgi:hypothetical protein